MTPTSYGYKLPDNNDLSKGTAGWFAQLLFNWARISAHSHNGTDSVALTAAAVATSTVTAPSGSWVVAGALYSQLVTSPAVITEISNVPPRFLNASTGAPLALEYVRVSATTFTLYCNDNTIDVLCVFR